MAQLESAPGNQLVIVRYGPEHYYAMDWVYNAADIDGSKWCGRVTWDMIKMKN